MEAYCPDCKTVKSLTEFFKNKSSKIKRNAYCKICSTKRVKEYRQKNKEKINEYERNRYNKNVEISRTRNKAKYAKNPKQALARVRKRQAAKINRTPPWLTKDHLQQIKLIYELCPPGHHVDHIIPLQGKTVSGLHVPWNLQYLKAQDNLKKHNRV